MVKEFVKRYKTNKDALEERKKGMIGEILVHVILEFEYRFLTVSPFFNMEERSLKKGYDVALLETATNELWITGLPTIMRSMSIMANIIWEQWKNYLQDM